MFWLPYLSLVVFLLLIIPSVIYGFKKGWVYSLIFSFTLWAVTLVFVGVNYLIYKYLWQAYLKLFLEKNIKVEMSLDNLSNFYKSQIILLTTGMEIILIYPITFFLMFFINKLIRQYFGHKVQDISKSEKSIFYRRKINLSRFWGTVILTISSLFSISLIASAINVVTIPYKKSNFATSFNDQISKIYSLGFSENAKSAQIISNFISYKLNKKIANSMKALVAFESNENPNLDNFFPNVEEIKYFKDNISKFKELFNDKKATEAIFTSIIKQKIDSLNPLTFDKNLIAASKDSNDNTIGYGKKINNNDLDALKSFVKNNKISLKKDLVEVLVSKLKKSFIDFTRTIFYKNYKAWLLKKDEYNGEIVVRKKELSNHKNLLLSLKDNRRRIISWLVKSSGTSFNGDYNLNTPLSFSTLVLERITPGTGTFKNEFELEKNKKAIRDTDEEDKNTKQNIYMNYKHNNYDLQKIILDNAKQFYDNAKTQLAYWKQELLDISTSKKMTNSKIQTLKSNIKKINSEIDAIRKNIGAFPVKRIEIDEIVSKIHTYNKQLALKRKSLKKTNMDLNTAKSQLGLYEKRIQKLEQDIVVQKAIIETQKNTLDSIQKVFNPINNTNNIKRHNFESARVKFAKSDQEYRRQKQIVDKLINEYKSKKNDLEFENEKIVDTKTRIDVLENEDLTLSFKAPAKKWSKKDDGSIFYFEELLKFCQDKINQTFKIQENKKKIFEKLKKDIILNYRKFWGI